MRGILAGFGMIGSVSIVYMVTLIAGLLMPHVPDTGRTVLSALFFASIAVAIFIMNDYLKAVEEKGWKAVFHPLTLVILANIIGAFGLTALISA